MVTFTARRSEPRLVAPARPTPRETKALPEIDGQHGMRFYSSLVCFFRGCPAGDDGDRRGRKDPAVVIGDALAEALVYYYPMAGRLRETAGGKLVVDCTGEGVVFVEADADVRLEEFGQPFVPPYSCVGEFFCASGDTRVVVGKPLVFMQVTRLKCGGYVIGSDMCHSMADGFGMAQFLRAIAELARGEARPVILPVWERHLLMPRTFPRITHTHLAYEPFLDSLSATDDVMRSTPPEQMEGQYFVFGQREVAALRGHAPEHLRRCSTRFDLLTAATWRCRTLALGYEPDKKVRIMFTTSARGRWTAAQLPQGFYGNAALFQAVETTAGALCRRPLGYALELVRKAKSDASDEENMKSMVDMMALRRGAPFILDRTYTVVNFCRVGIDALDFGSLGKWVYSGVAMVGDVMCKLPSCYTRCKNRDGKDCIAVSMYLPRPAMDRFATQIAVWSKMQGKTFTPSSM